MTRYKMIKKILFSSQVFEKSKLITQFINTLTKNGFILFKSEYRIVVCYNDHIYGVWYSNFPYGILSSSVEYVPLEEYLKLQKTYDKSIKTFFVNGEPKEFVAVPVYKNVMPSKLAQIKFLWKCMSEGFNPNKDEPADMEYINVAKIKFSEKTLDKSE